MQVTNFINTFPPEKNPYRFKFTAIKHNYHKRLTVTENLVETELYATTHTAFATLAPLWTRPIALYGYCWLFV